MLTLCHTAIKKHVIKYCEKVYERTWSVENPGDIFNKLKSKGFLASSKSINDFSTLYTT